MALESDRGSRRRGMITACRGARRMVTEDSKYGIEEFLDVKYLCLGGIDR